MDETNQLLREIRDLMASREQQYQQHLADIGKAYDEQLRRYAAERRKSAWIAGGLFLLLAMFVAFAKFAG